MKAFIFRRYGSPEVMELAEVERPTPLENQVLVKVHAAAVNAYDWRIVTATPFFVRLMGGGFFRPKMNVGADIAGTVESVGVNVSDFKPGDHVFGSLSITGNGGFAEYAIAGEEYLAHVPKGVSFDEAAAAPMAALTALQGLRDTGKLQPGDEVAINGASGGVGTYAVQIAKMFGAEVTAICSSAKVKLVRSLGADYVVDYTKEDFTDSGKLYNLILGVNGFHPIRHYQRSLKSDGIYVMAGGSTRQILQATLRGPMLSKRGSQTMTNIDEKPNRVDLEYIKDKMAAGVIKSIIDRRFPFEEVPSAISYVAEGHAAGKVVVNVVDPK